MRRAICTSCFPTIPSAPKNQLIQLPVNRIFFQQALDKEGRTDVMTDTEIKEIVQKHRTYFYTGATLDVRRRVQALMKLKRCIEVMSSN